MLQLQDSVGYVSKGYTKQQLKELNRLVRKIDRKSAATGKYASVPFVVVPSASATSQSVIRSSASVPANISTIRNVSRTGSNNRNSALSVSKMWSFDCVIYVTFWINWTDSQRNQSRLLESCADACRSSSYGDHRICSKTHTHIYTWCGRNPNYFFKSGTVFFSTKAWHLPHCWNLLSFARFMNWLSNASGERVERYYSQLRF